MDNKKDNSDSLFELSRRLQRSSEISQKFVELYWALMFSVTRMIESTFYRGRIELQEEAVLYFGCGTNFSSGVNSGLFAVHRYLKRRRRPDVYLTGVSTPIGLQNRFKGVVTEHVLEHMLPIDGHLVLCNLYKMLEPGGTIQISVPSPVRFIQCTEAGLSMDVIGINDIVYNYGHRFMYDEEALCSLLASAGFEEIEVNTLENSPWSDFLSVDRQPQSIYVCAKKCPADT